MGSLDENLILITVRESSFVFGYFFIDSPIFRKFTSCFKIPHLHVTEHISNTKLYIKNGLYSSIYAHDPFFYVDSPVQTFD